MHGDKEVGLIAVGDLSAFIQLYEDIALTRIDHFDIRTVTLHHPSESQGKLQSQVLFLRDSAHCSCVVTTVAGINNECELLVCSIG